MYHGVTTAFHGSTNKRFQKFSNRHYHCHNSPVVGNGWGMGAGVYSFSSFSSLEPFSSIGYIESEMTVGRTLTLCTFRFLELSRNLRKQRRHYSLMIFASGSDKQSANPQTLMHLINSYKHV